MSNPLISVIIPCYNYAEFLEECVNSVIEQTYENLEVVIINDGSTDDTDKVAKRLASKHDIKYVKQQNIGIVATRNKAIKIARGEYIIQLDADDYLDPDYVEKTLETALKTKADIIYTNFKTFGDQEYVSDFPDFNIEILKNSNFIHTSALLKKESIKGYRFDTKLDSKTHEDWDYFLNLCIHGLRATPCHETLLNYRIHATSRNNRLDTSTEEKDYAELYSYMITKYSQEFPEQFNYLAGKLFSDRLLKEINDSREIIQQKDHEIMMIKASRFWKARNIVAKLTGREVI